jgi:hypothetical protein
MRMMILACALSIALASPGVAAPSVNLNWKEECYRDASVYLKLVRMVMARRYADGEEVSPRLRAEFARTMRTAKSWKTAVSKPSRQRRKATRRVVDREEAGSLVSRLRENLRTCHSLIPD